MFHSRIEALFGRNRDGHRTMNFFQRRQKQQQQQPKPTAPVHSQHEVHPSEQDELAKYFSSKPHLEKELHHEKTFAFAAMQGWRSSMEDQHKHRLELDDHSWKLWSFFAIFDGHHGFQTAKHAANQLDAHLLDALNQVVPKKTIESNETSEEFIHSSQLDLQQLSRAIKQTYFQLDLDLKEVVRDDSGCVCITCLVGPENIYLINIGDSRAIIFSKEGQVLVHTEDHKPDDPAEQERIHEAGGKISKSSVDDVLRVENQLAMTRVLGDFGINKDIVPAMADIIEYPRSSSSLFVLLACDGIWDVMSNEEVARFVVDRYQSTSLQEIVSQLLDECLRRESTDNMSVYLIEL